MTSPPGQPPDPRSSDSAPPRERSAEDVAWGRLERRRERIRAEIHRNRQGGHRLPTWVLAAILGAVLIAWIYLIATA
jgi:hypothetical protein